VQDVERFVSFPFELYRFCSQWVPPLVSGVKTDLNRRKHPFYTHSKADYFVAESDGQVLGRIGALYNRNYNAYHQTNVAFFGFLEFVEDRQVAHALFDAAFAWGRARGADSIMGPKGLIGSDGGGILVEGFEHRPALGTTYNLPYYDAFIKDAGFDKERDFYSAYIGRGIDLPERFYLAADKIKARRGIWIKNFRSKRELRRWAPRAIEAHGKAFSQNHTYYPPTPEEVDLLIETVFTIADPRLIKLVMKGEQIIGVVLGLPDVTAGLQKSHGHLWPFGWLHILRERRRTKRTNFPALGLLPDYQGLGGNAVLYAELAQTLLSSGYNYAEFVQVDEHNFKSLREINALEVIWNKTHRSYQRTL
jgi:GNAT superfamily N-acetyltransferase